MGFRVEITEGPEQVRRGFLSREDDDNPNSNVAVREFSGRESAFEAIDEAIADNGDTTLVYWILSDDGYDRGGVWFEGGEWNRD